MIQLTMPMPATPDMVAAFAAGAASLGCTTVELGDGVITAALDLEPGPLPVPAVAPPAAPPPTPARSKPPAKSRKQTPGPSRSTSSAPSAGRASGGPRAGSCGHQLLEQLACEPDGTWTGSASSLAREVWPRAPRTAVMEVARLAETGLVERAGNGARVDRVRITDAGLRAVGVTHRPPPADEDDDLDAVRRAPAPTPARPATPTPAPSTPPGPVASVGEIAAGPLARHGFDPAL